MHSKLSILFKALKFIVAAGFGAATAGVVLLMAAYLYLASDLPSIESLKDVKLQVPLRVFTRDGSLISEFGEKRRSPVQYSSVPDLMVKAFLAAEDDRFFTHPGVDYQGLMRAAWHLIKTGEKGQGGSTITMQVARNFFLSREKTYLRKLNEIFLALKIENELSKGEILELYLNKIYLGNRAYGVQAAAQVYYGVNFHELTLAQTAMIAGLPKAPSRFNPIINPKRAITRRNYVLNRMRSLGFITSERASAAINAPVTASLHGRSIKVEAPYVAEMVRAEMVSRYGNNAYTDGYRVYTTLDSAYQSYANSALRNALLEYDERHGYRGPEQHIQIQENDGLDAGLELLREINSIGGLAPALVTVVQDKGILAVIADGSEIWIDWDGLKWARKYINDNRKGPKPKTAAEILKPGDIIRVTRVSESSWKLSQIPVVAGALVALKPKDGSIMALVGGFDYFQSKFNRVIQALRQPGSSFKPFIYSAALEKDFTPASLINDAPVVFEDSALENTWRPENYSGKFYGPTRLREALVHSRNLVSIRLLRAIGVRYAIEYASRFGIPAENLPRDLSLSLGSGSITPLQLATAYSVFANGGYRVEPYFISHIESESGEILFQADPEIACLECEKALQKEQAVEASQENVASVDDSTPVQVLAGETEEEIKEPDAKPVKLAKRVMTAQNNYLMQSMMRDVIRRGTGRKALQLGRRDIAGKTGTTNDQRDAWFSGYNAELVATAWVGFDQVRPLGRRETGGRAALPMWIQFMSAALKGIPISMPEEPPGLVTVRIDPKSGLLAGRDIPDAVFETFREDRVPRKMAHPGEGIPDTVNGTTGAIPEQIF